MVNTTMSNLGIRLDNFGAKSLNSHETKMRMVADAVGFEPVSNSKISEQQGKIQGKPEIWAQNDEGITSKRSIHAGF